MMNDVVIVTSMVDAVVGFTVPEHHYSRSWPKKGAKLPISKDILREAIYMPGIETLFRKGYLYMDDMEFKIELGLEEIDATPETAKIIALDDKLCARLIKTMPAIEAEKHIDKLSKDQLRELADYAVNHYKDLDMSRIDMLNKKCKVDILKAVQFKKDMEE